MLVKKYVGLCLFTRGCWFDKDYYSSYGRIYIISYIIYGNRAHYDGRIYIIVAQLARCVMAIADGWKAKQNQLGNASVQNGGSFHDLPATLGVGNPNKKSNATVPTFSNTASNIHMLDFLRCEMNNRHDFATSSLRTRPRENLLPMKSVKVEGFCFKIVALRSLKHDTLFRDGFRFFWETGTCNCVYVYSCFWPSRSKLTAGRKIYLFQW